MVGENNFRENSRTKVRVEVRVRSSHLAENERSNCTPLIFNLHPLNPLLDTEPSSKNSPLHRQVKYRASTSRDINLIPFDSGGTKGVRDFDIETQETLPKGRLILDHGAYFQS